MFQESQKDAEKTPVTINRKSHIAEKRSHKSAPVKARTRTFAPGQDSGVSRAKRGGGWRKANFVAKAESLYNISVDRNQPSGSQHVEDIAVQVLAESRNPAKRKVYVGN